MSVTLFQVRGDGPDVPPYWPPGGGVTIDTVSMGVTRMKVPLAFFNHSSGSTGHHLFVLFQLLHYLLYYLVGGSPFFLHG